MPIDSAEAFQISERAIATTTAYEHLKSACRKAQRHNIPLRPHIKAWWNQGKTGRANTSDLEQYKSMLAAIIQDAGQHIDLKSATHWLKANS